MNISHLGIASSENVFFFPSILRLQLGPRNAPTSGANIFRRVPATTEEPAKY